LHGFSSEDPNAGPVSAVIFDAAGNLYGTTRLGGSYYNGTVFRLVPQPDGKWKETVLHNFGNGKDGSGPVSLIFDAAGNLYGTTTTGGAYESGCHGGGCGTVFELSPGYDGKWTERVLHSFGKGTDGVFPSGSLIFDAVGNLYGTTWTGGAHSSACSGQGCGTVFQLIPGTNGKWTERVLHSFNHNGRDGNGPDSSLIFDPAGNLYGTTRFGGTYGSSCGGLGCGTVFQVRP
jgi:beta-xylosidase